MLPKYNLVMLVVASICYEDNIISTQYLMILTSQVTIWYCLVLSVIVTREKWREKMSCS